MLKSTFLEFLILGPNDSDLSRFSGEKDCNYSAQIPILDFLTSELLQDYQKKSDFSLQNLKRLQENKKCIESKLLEMSKLEIEKKFKTQIQRQRKLEILIMAEKLKSLWKPRPIETIPEIIFSIVESSPPNIPNHSKLKQLIIKTSNHLKSQLLTDFLIEFEKSLNESEIETTDLSPIQSDSIPLISLQNFQSEPQPNSLSESSSFPWVKFLKGARPWLLAFSIVSLFPFALGDTRTQCFDQYNTVLDEALTPLWGRLLFHLTTARFLSPSSFLLQIHLIPRESYSFDQLLWTFSYSFNFLELLLDLLGQLSLPSHQWGLHRLCPGDYLLMGGVYVLDKTCRFLRSHLVQSVTEYLGRGLLDPDRAVLIIEQTIQFDDNTHRLLRDYLQTHSPSSILPSDPLPCVSPVLFDLKPLLSLWACRDYEFFSSSLSTSLSRPIADIFNPQFGFEVCSDALPPVPSILLSGDSSGLDEGERERFLGSDFMWLSSSVPIQYSGYRCYSSLFHCLSLLSLALHRYQPLRLSPQAQDLFSEGVLEPLLLSSLSLLLLRILSVERLFVLFSKADLAETSEGLTEGDSRGRGRGTGRSRGGLLSAMSSINIDLPRETPPPWEQMRGSEELSFEALSEFVSCSRYFLSSLSSLHLPTLQTQGSDQRLRTRWTRITQTLPLDRGIYYPPDSLTNPPSLHPLSPMGVCRLAFLTPPSPSPIKPPPKELTPNHFPQPFSLPPCSLSSSPEDIEGWSRAKRAWKGEGSGGGSFMDCLSFARNTVEDWARGMERSHLTLFASTKTS